jgi:hypothetical protein
MGFNWFNAKKASSFFAKLKGLNAKQKFADKIEKAYYLGGVVYNDENYTNVLQAVYNNTLDEFLKTRSYNTQQDNIELYWVKDDKDESKILLVLDPVELYESEKVLEIISSTNDYWINLSGAQLIYPSP